MLPAHCSTSRQLRWQVACSPQQQVACYPQQLVAQPPLLLLLLPPLQASQQTAPTAIRATLALWHGRIFAGGSIHQTVQQLPSCTTWR
jgi:hypothetical protein